MNYRKSSIDIIRDIVESLTFPVTILSASNLGSGVHELEVCDMYFAQIGFTVTIGGKIYTITGIVPAGHPDCGIGSNDLIKVKGDASNITATTFDLYKPFFFHGTPIAQGTELAQVTQAKNKTPMVWVNDGTLEEIFYHNDLENKDRELKFDWYCLTQANPEKWATDQAWDEAIEPMARLRQIVIAKIKTMEWLFPQENMKETSKPYAKFGVYLANRGMEKSLWHDKLAGVGNSMTLEINRNDAEACEDCES